MGRGVFRSLSRGGEYVTALQLARRAGEEGAVPSYRVLGGRLGRGEVEGSAVGWVEGKQPGLQGLVKEVPASFST